MRLDYVFFDCWDTLIRYCERNEDFIEPIYETVLDKKNVTLSDVKRIEKEVFDDYFFGRTYEVKLSTLIRLVFTLAGLTLSINDEEIERLWCLNYDPKPMAHTVDFLKFLKGQNIKAACLSNTVLSNKTTKEYIHNTLKIGEGEFLQFILTSADWGAKKPNPFFFKAGMKLAGLNEKSVALYVGDSFSSDIVGAARSGLFPCYYNHKNKTPYKKDLVQGYFEFNDYLQLKEFILNDEIGEIIVEPEHRTDRYSHDW